MVYIHIPFCGSFCTYCGFYSEIAEGRIAGQYVGALCSEISARNKEAVGEPDTLYIGGGTPSVLPLSAVRKIVSTVEEQFPDCGGSSRQGFREFTFEANPEDIVRGGRPYVEGLASCGVNRISMGVQSFDDRILKWMNRRHDAAGAVRAFNVIRESGMGNISIDLIFGIDHMDDELWESVLDRAVSLRPQHISAYQLSVEPESVLASMASAGKYTEASESLCIRQYSMLCRKLAEAGYHHYEISNFALPGYEALHNSAYWRHVPYSGFGPGAHSLRIEGPEDDAGQQQYIRFWNIPDVRKYISCYQISGRLGDGCRSETACNIVQSERLTPEQIAIERIMLGLRTDSGVEKSYLSAHTNCSGLEKMVGGGFLVPASDPSFLRIPEKHFFISDSIIEEII